MSTNGIDFVIGGKDQASPALSEVEKSMDKLIDQQIAYDRIQKKLTTTTKTATDAIQSQSNTEKSLTATSSRLTMAVGALAVAYGAVKAGIAAIGGINALNAAYDQQAEAVKGLEVALKLQGASVDAGSSRLQALAGDMQKLTGAGDAATASLKKQASALGSTSENLDGTAKAAMGLSEAASKSLDESMKRQSDSAASTVDSITSVANALSPVGEAIEQESARLQTFASDMQKLTGVGDEVTIGLMKQASMLGVSSSQLDDVTKAAIGLSEATGKSLDESLKLVTNSLAGEFGAFGEIIPAIKDMTTKEEQLHAVLELSAKGLKAKAESSNTVAGMSERASGAIGDLMESVGALLAPVRILISQGLKTLAESLQTLLVPAVQYAEEVLANIGPVMDWVKEKVIQGINGIVAAFTFFEVIVTNLDGIWTIIVSQTELSMRQMGETVMHTVTEVIPGYVIWFGENIVNLFKDAFNGVVTIISNAGGMIADIIKEIWTFVFQDMGAGSAALGDRIGAILASGLTTGFESSLTALPDIAARTLTDREKELAETIGDIGGRLGEEFSRKMKERMIGVGDGLSDEFSSAINLSVNGASAAKNLAARKDGTFGQSINASESRLLTRGPASSFDKLLEATDRVAGEAVKHGEILLRTGEWVKASAEELQEMNRTNPGAVRMVPTT